MLKIEINAYANACPVKKTTAVTLVAQNLKFAINVKIYSVYFISSAYLSGQLLLIKISNA